MIPHPARAATYHDHLATLHQQLADIRAWRPSAQRDAHLERIEAEIEDAMSCAELADEQAECAEELEIEVMSPAEIALDDACSELRKIGVARLRWRVDGEVIIGSGAGAWAALIERIGAVWSCRIVGTYWDEERGEEGHGLLVEPVTASSPSVAAIMALTALQAAAQQVAA